MCDEMENDLEITIDQAMTRLIQKIQLTAEAIEGDVDNFQGERSKIPLFKDYPNLGEKAELALEAAKEEKTKICNLTEPARRRAIELYGADIVPPNSTE